MPDGKDAGRGELLKSIEGKPALKKTDGPAEKAGLTDEQKAAYKAEKDGK